MIDVPAFGTRQQNVSEPHMNEIFSRIKVSGRQVATVVAFVVVASVAQMAIPSMLGAMIDKGVG